MEYFNYLIRNIFVSALAVTWMMGIVMAKGPWLTTFSIINPFYAWYLVVERAMLLSGFGT